MLDCLLARRGAGVPARRLGTTMLPLPVALVAAAILSACAPAAVPGAPAGSGNGAPSAQQNQGEPKRGGYLRDVLPYSAQSIDPHTTDDPTGYGFIARAWYEPLVSIDYRPGEDWRIENKVVPFIAEKWTQDDPKTYTFTLRKGVKFHNGDDLTAQDVVFTYRRLINPQEKISPTVKQNVVGIASVEATDDFTVRLVAKTPDPDFLRNLAQHLVAIVPKKFVENGGDLGKQAVGTGPFKLTSYVKDAQAVAVRNDAYWQQSRPYLDGIKMLLKVDDSTMAAAFAAGEADILMRNDKNQFSPIQAANSKVLFAKTTVNSMYNVAFNVSRPPLDDPRVRRAIHLALDRQQIDKVLSFGEGVLSGPLIIAGKKGWTIPDEELAQLPGYRQPKAPDIAEAKRLMQEAGLSSGFKTTIGFNQLYAAAPAASEVVQSQLRQSLGITSELLPWDNPTFVQRRSKGDYDIVVTLDGGNMDRPAVAAVNFFHSQGTYAAAIGLKDAELDRLIDAQSSEFDERKRGELFVQMQRVILDKMYQAPLPLPTVYALWQPWIHDWVDNRANRQTLMNPWAIWMDADQAPADRRKP